MKPSISNSDTVTQSSLRGDILFAFSLAVALYAAWKVHEVLTLLYVCALLAVVLTPVVSSVMRLHIRHRHPSRVVAILMLMLGLLLLATIFLLLTLPHLIRDARSFLQDIPHRSALMADRVRGVPLLRAVDFAAVATRLQQYATQDAGAFLYSLSTWADKLLDILTGIVLTVYFLIEGEQIYGWFISLVPPARRQRLDTTLRRASVRMERWLLGQSMLMLILAVTSGIVLALLHVRYALALAILLGVSNIIPVVGALVTGSLALLAAAMDSWTKVLSVFVFGIIYAQIENAYLTPRIMRTSVNLTGTAVLVALLLGVSFAGVAGAMVAIPTAVLVSVLVEEYVAHAPEREPPSSDNLLS